MRSLTLVALLLIGLHAIHAEEVASAVSHSVEHAPAAGAPSGPVTTVLVGEQHQQPANQVVASEHVHHQQVAGGVGHAQFVPAHYAAHQGDSLVSYYAQQPAGLISVVGGGQHQAGSIVNKPIGQQPVQAGAPVQPVGHYAASQVLPPVGAEQYGQPESASVPPNYKPFGSWGLYIGGNPSDGYYTNYYKSLGSSVEKQVSSEVVPAAGQQVAAVNRPVAVSGPVLRQAVGPAYLPAEGAYAYDHGYYTPADLASNQAVFPKPSSSYETPSASFNPSSSVLSYADQSATKRLVQQQQVPVVQQQQQQSSKGYQARSGYFYSQAPLAAPAQQQVFQPQVVAYPVPVGSQIVGSQPGVEGAYYPYGVHAFTRYAVKPTLVASNEVMAAAPTTVGQQYYTSKSQQQQQQQQQVAAPHYFYGYPLSQLHYAAEVSPPVGSPFSGRSSVVEHHEAPQNHHPVPVVGEASDKFESVSQQDKPVIDKQHKRA